MINAAPASGTSQKSTTACYSQLHHQQRRRHNTAPTSIDSSVVTGEAVLHCRRRFSLAHERRQRTTGRPHPRRPPRPPRWSIAPGRMNTSSLSIAVQATRCGRAVAPHPNRGSPRDRRGAVHPVSHRDTDASAGWWRPRSAAWVAFFMNPTAACVMPQRTASRPPENADRRRA